MGEPSTKGSISSRHHEALIGFQTSLIRLVEETVRKEMAAARPASNRNLGGVPAELKKTITEAVTGVLIETNFLERLVDRQVKACFASIPPACNGGTDEVRGLIQKEIKAFLASEELKELIDGKFRMINHYLKTEVIPKVVQQELAKS